MVFFFNWKLIFDFQEKGVIVYKKNHFVVSNLLEINFTKIICCFIYIFNNKTSHYLVLIGFQQGTVILNYTIMGVFNNFIFTLLIIYDTITNSRWFGNVFPNDKICWFRVQTWWLICVMLSTVLKINMSMNNST